MISFENDYNVGAHPEVLKALIGTNAEPLSGYGNDPYTARAKEKIKEACGGDIDVEFLVGGTQTNALVIDTVLKPYEGVIAATTGHINVHEAGAVEFTGRKILALPEHDGKIDADELQAYLEKFYADGNHEHMVFPGMVYISHPTEYGTLYSKAELTKIHEICRAYKIPLFADGARLAYAVTAKDSDVALEDMKELTDIFYIGGTKAGTLVGEAVCFTKGWMPKHFTTQVKQHGAMLAKGRVLGVEFDALFSNDLFFRIGRHVNEKALKLREILHEKNCAFLLESPTNQQFIIVDNETMKALGEKVAFSFWDTIDENHTAIRFVTNFLTSEEDLQALREAL